MSDTRPALPLDMMAVWDIMEALEDAAPGGQLTREIIDRVAQEQGVPRSHVFVAAGTNPTFETIDDADSTVVVCTGGTCQRNGSRAVLDSLCDARAEAERRGAGTFAILAFQCLDLCDHGPILRIRTPHGLATEKGVDPDKVAGLVEHLVSEEPPGSETPP
jgi:NADH:ubiquinone oxidoreductase subunit E